MNRFVFRSRLILGILIIAMIFLIFTVSYIPVNNELKQITIENFYHTSSANYATVNNAVIKNIDSTRSMSSRSAIREKIVEYHQGIVTFKELSDFTYGKYEDGYKVVDNVLLAIRIVDSQEVCRFGDQHIDYQKAIDYAKTVMELEYTIDTTGSYTMTVYSPIFQDNKLFGHDIMVYSLDEVMESVIQDYSIVQIISGSDLGTCIPIKNIGQDIFVEGSTIKFTKQVGEKSYFCISIEESVLFETINRISLSNILKTLVLVFLLLIVINFFIINFAKKLMAHIISQHDIYKEKATVDALTGFYTRHFLNQFFSDLQKESEINICLVMMDIDKFKSINDQYGHSVGDDVLAYVGEKMSDLVRDNDFIIRYGGDEFLIIFQAVQIQHVEQLVNRIIFELESNNPFPFQISISYGLAEVHQRKDFYDGIKKADQSMYESKK